MLTILTTFLTIVLVTYSLAGPIPTEPWDSLKDDKTMERFHSNLLNQTTLTFLNDCYSSTQPNQGNILLCARYFDAVRQLNETDFVVNQPEIDKIVHEDPIVEDFCAQKYKFPTSKYYQLASKKTIDLSNTMMCGHFCIEMPEPGVITTKPICKLLVWMGEKLDKLPITVPVDTANFDGTVNEKSHLLGHEQTIKEMLKKVQNNIASKPEIENSKMIDAHPKIDTKAIEAPPKIETKAIGAHPKISTQEKNETKPLAPEKVSVSRINLNSSSEVNFVQKNAKNPSAPENPINKEGPPNFKTSAQKNEIPIRNPIETPIGNPVETPIKTPIPVDTIPALSTENKIPTEQPANVEKPAIVDQPAKPQQNILDSPSNNDLPIDNDSAIDLPEENNSEDIDPDNEDFETNQQKLKAKGTQFDDNEQEQKNSPEIIDRNYLPNTNHDTDPFFEESGSNFFTYFLIGMFSCIIMYVVYHNKSKILALLLEGRRGDKGRSGRRKHTAAYRKLDSNLEEAITSSASGRTTQIIY